MMGSVSSPITTRIVIIVFLLLTSALAKPKTYKLDFQSELSKLQPRDTSSSSSSSSSTVLDNLSNISPFSFNFSIGSPPQNLSGLITNLFGDILVDHYTSEKCLVGNNNVCPSYSIYNSSSSSTFIDTKIAFTINTTTTPWNGTYIDETLHFGGLELKNIPIGVMIESTLSKPFFGIGYPQAEGLYESYGKVYENFPMILKNKGYTDSVLYSIWPNSKNDFSGSILFGGVDAAKFTGNLTTFPIMPEDGEYIYPIINIPYIFGVGGKKRVAANVATFLAFGTPDSSLPDVVLNEVLSSFPYKMNTTSGYYEGECHNTTDEISLSLPDGTLFPVPLQPFSLRYSNRNDNRCFLRVQASNSADLVFGYGFFASSFVAFDLEYNYISIAQASFSNESQIIDISASNNMTNSSGSSNTSTISISIPIIRSITSNSTASVTPTGTFVLDTSSYDWDPITTAVISTTSTSNNGAGAGVFKQHSDLLLSFPIMQVVYFLFFLVTLVI